MKKTLVTVYMLSNFISSNSHAYKAPIIDENSKKFYRSMQEIYKKYDLQIPVVPEGRNEYIPFAQKNLKNLEELTKQEKLSIQEIDTIKKTNDFLLIFIEKERENILLYPESEERKVFLKNLENFENEVKANKSNATLKYSRHYHRHYDSVDKKDKLSVLSSIVKNELKPNKDGKLVLGYDEVLTLYNNNKEFFDKALSDINNNPDQIPGILSAAQKMMSNVALEPNLSKATSDADTAKLNNSERALLFVANAAQALKTAESQKNEYEKVKSQIANNAIENQALLYALSNIKSRLLTNSITSENLGSSSGEEQNNLQGGIWASGTYGHSIQKKNKIFSGYNSNLRGITIGGDIALNEMLSLGLAYSNITSKFNYKHERAKDKTTAKTHAYSIYGQFDNDYLVWSNIASFAQSNASNKNDRMNIATASSSVKSKAYSFETNLGYKIIHDNINFIPNIGARYLHNKVDGYTETGAGVYNMNVGKGSLDIISGIIGAKLMSSYQVSEEVKFIPSIHAALEGNYIKNISDIQYKYIWMDKYVATKGMKKKEFLAPSYNAGVNLLAKTNIVEASIGYDFNGMKDYQSHQGTLKLKILF